MAARATCTKRSTAGSGTSFRSPTQTPGSRPRPSGSTSRYSIA